MRTALLSAIAAVLLSTAVNAEELKYMPINPSFGGSPFNGPNLMANASAQRQKAPTSKRDPASQFADTIQSSIMSSVARNIADAITGEGAKQSGSFAVGSTKVEFHRDGDQIIININDPAQGGETVISMPVPTY